MSSRALLNLVMLAAVVAAAALLHTRQPPDDEARSGHALVPVAPTDLRSITIARTDGPPIELRRDEDQWEMRRPVKARLEETALARLLDLSRLQVGSRLPADDLARYGLDNPWARVRFEQHELAFGSTNTVTEELYVMSASAVFAIPARSATAIPGTPSRLIAHRMFSPRDVPEAITLAEFRVRHDGSRWNIEPPDPSLSQDDLIRWIDRWRHASSIATQPGTAADAADVVVQLRDGRRLEFAIKARVPDLVLHRRDEGLDYHFTAGQSVLLSAPSSAEPAGR